jgi:hypothetical protein
MSALYLAPDGKDIGMYGTHKDRPARTLRHLRGKTPLDPHPNWIVPGTTIFLMADYDLASDPAFQTVINTTAPTLSSVVNWPGAAADSKYITTSFGDLVESGTSTAPIVIRPFGSNIVTLTGNGRIGSVGLNILMGASYVVIERMRFSGFLCALFINPYTLGNAPPSYDTSHHILIRECIFEKLVTQPTKLFDMPPGAQCDVNGTAIYTNQRSHHISIIRCRFIDLWYKGVLPSGYWHLLSAIFRDSLGRVYHRLIHPDGHPVIVRRPGWGAFKLSDTTTEILAEQKGGDFLAPTLFVGDQLTPLGIETCTALKLSPYKAELVTKLKYSPNHWFQHAHSIYAQGYEILVRNCHFNFNSLTWHIKIDGNFGTFRRSKTAVAKGLNALTPDLDNPQYYFFDMLPQTHAELAQEYGIDSTVGANVFTPSDFPGGNADQVVRTHRIESNVFDAWNTYSPEKMSGIDILSPDPETTRHMAAAIMAGSNLKPHFAYAIQSRQSNLVVFRNGAGFKADLVTGMQITDLTPKESVEIDVIPWGPRNVSIHDNIFFPPTPWEPFKPSTGNGTAAVLIADGVWGWFVNVPTKQVDGMMACPVNGAKVAFVLAMQGTEFYGNIIMGPVGKPNQLSNVFRFTLMPAFVTEAGTIPCPYTSGGMGSLIYGTDRYLVNGYPGAPGSGANAPYGTFLLNDKTSWWPSTWDPGVDPFTFYHLSPLTAAGMTLTAPLVKSEIPLVAKFIGAKYGFILPDLTQQIVKPKTPNYFWSFG